MAKIFTKFRLVLTMVGFVVIACENQPAREKAKPPVDIPQDAGTDSSTVTDAQPNSFADTLAQPVDSGNLADSGFQTDSGFSDASPFISDRDNDGLPDSEDPEPDRINLRIYEDSFSSVGTEWLFTSVSMKIDANSEHLTVSQVEPFVREGWIGPRPEWADVFLKTRLRITGTGRDTSSGAGQVGLMGHVNQLTPDRYLVCGLNLATETLFISEHNGGTAQGRVLAEAKTDIKENEWFDLSFDMKGAALSCSANDLRITASSSLYFAGAIGFRSFDASFDADFVEVYAR